MPRPLSASGTSPGARTEQVAQKKNASKLSSKSLPKAATGIQGLDEMETSRRTVAKAVRDPTVLRIRGSLVFQIPAAEQRMEEGPVGLICGKTLHLLCLRSGLQGDK